MIDFQQISSNALSRALYHLERWLPGGHVVGHEYIAKNPKRNDRNAGSFRVNLRTGKWADFAEPDARGRDLISLYAYLNNISQAEAAQELRFEN